MKLRYTGKHFTLSSPNLLLKSEPYPSFNILQKKITTANINNY